MRELASIALDGALCAVTFAHAAWLETHKDGVPDHIWKQVAVGTGYTLAHAIAQGALSRGDWSAQVYRTLRAFALSGTIIIGGELKQAHERRANRLRYQSLRQ